MQPFKTHTGVAAPLNRVNVDTDAIIPKQFLRKIEKTVLVNIFFMNGGIAIMKAPRRTLILF